MLISLLSLFKNVFRYYFFCLLPFSHYSSVFFSISSVFGYFSVSSCNHCFSSMFLVPRCSQTRLCYTFFLISAIYTFPFLLPRSKVFYRFYSHVYVLITDNFCAFTLFLNLNFELGFSLLTFVLFRNSRAIFASHSCLQ